VLNLSHIVKITVHRRVKLRALEIGLGKST
jgi:hypothetical protein